MNVRNVRNGDGKDLITVVFKWNATDMEIEAQERGTPLIRQRIYLPSTVTCGDYLVTKDLMTLPTKT